jgi:hypothetical protein
VRIVSLFALAALATGCIRFEVARLARVSAAPARAAQRSEVAIRGMGRSCVTIVAIFPVTPMPNIGDAIADASDGAGALRNAVVRYELRYVPFVGGRSCYVVEGEPE